VRNGSNGVAALDATYRLLLRNAAGTITSILANSATAARTYTLPDASGTLVLSANPTFTGTATATDFAGMKRVDNTNETTLANGFAGGTLHMNYRGATTAITRVNFCDGRAGGVLTQLAVADLECSSQNGGPLAGFRNAIINGKFDIWQRGTSFSIPPGATTYTADRWIAAFGGSTNGNVSRADFGTGVSPLDGSVLVFGVPAGAAGSNLRQRMENVNTFSGKTVKVSFWAQNLSGATSLTCTFVQNFGTGGTPSADVNTGTSGSAVLGSGYAKYEFTATIPSTSGKTLGANGNHYLELQIGTSSSAAHQFAITGVQVEAGPSATPFEQRPIALELAMCQRYYQVLSPTAFYDSGAQVDTRYIYRPFLVQMRATPTAALSSSANVCWNQGGVDFTPSNFGIQGVLNQSVSISVSGGGGNYVAGVKNYTIYLNAEL
jgi:hypothetical protein